MPLVEPGLPTLSLFVWDVGREVEGMMVDALDLESGRELIVAVGHASTSQDVHLWLHWNRWSVWLC